MPALAANVMQFARILRRAGLPMGPGKVVAALESLHLIDIGRRDDVFNALQAAFVERHSQSDVYRLAFDRFWRANTEFGEGLPPDELAKPEKATAQRRVDEAFAQPRAASTAEENSEGARWSAAETLRTKDFAAMSAAEFADAQRLIATLRLPIPDVQTRRFRAGAARGPVDMRATLKAMVRSGGLIDLAHKRRVTRHPPLVVLCDISGSMEPYARMLLHFLHAITNDRDRVHVFLFGTRLTNVTREIAHRDPDDAIARVTKTVQDWSGGTRIGHILASFNRLWSRRVLAQGAVVLMISDGLDRDGGEGLGIEMARLHRSCRRLIWLNPLLRYAGFEPKSAGIRAMLPHVDDFRAVHNIDSLAGLIAALSAPVKVAA